MNTTVQQCQRGVVLLEALIGILIFSLGLLSMIALQATAIAVQADTQYRIEAANRADEIMGKIILNVNRTTPATIQTSLAAFNHLSTGAVTSCAYSGTASGNTDVGAWVTSITTTAATHLPGSTAAMQQIAVDTATFNKVTISICWQSPKDPAPRRHTIVSYIN